jgi:cytochrome o ubiquinol oxidase subunit IV
MKSYLLGFLISALLTLGAYLAVVANLFSSGVLVFLVVLCSLLQMGCQFVYFMRFGFQPEGHEAKGELPWNLLFFLFTILIALIVALGSLWIMDNLNYRM